MAKPIMSDDQFLMFGYGTVVYFRPTDKGVEIHAANGDLLRDNLPDEATAWQMTTASDCVRVHLH
jgi:hypothetical protein